MALILLLAFMQVVGFETAPLVGVRDWFNYTNGTKGERLGSYYEILLLNSKCDKLTVKVTETAPVITQEELDKANVSGSFIMAKFDGFEARPYATKDGNMNVSAKANKIILVNSKGGTV